MAGFSLPLSALETKAFIAAGQAWATQNGYERFLELREKQRGLRRDYVSELVDGSYVMRGGLLELFAADFDIADHRWFFYH